MFGVACLMVLVCFFILDSSESKKYHAAHSLECSVNKTYIPSALEIRWLNMIDNLHGENANEWKKGCVEINNDITQIKEWLRLQQSWQTEDLWGKEGTSWMKAGVLSYFDISESCGHHPVVHHFVPIEPLVGFLRHPLHICVDPLPSEKYVIDKEYLFLMRLNSVYPRIRRGIVGRKYLFDLGASTYTSGGGGVSQQWFVESYRKRGIDFERILAWEAEKHTVEKLFEQYPHDVAAVISYYNLPASPDITDKMSPVRMLKQLAKTDDVVIVKVDIDNDPIELAIVQSIMRDPAVYSLVDEFFFEHHVSGNPIWGGHKKIMNITESYALFSELRHKGIRAHSWV